MAVAARTLNRPELAASATRAVDFIRSDLWRDGRLLAAYKDGRSRFPAYLDDYAFLLESLLELLQTRWRHDDLLFAVDLADALLAHFEDSVAGGFFFTADDHETLIHRSKSFPDEAVPSGNGVAAQALMRLGLLLGETRYLDAAARTLRAAWRALQQYPHAHCSLLIALEEHLEPIDVVIVRGGESEIAEWRDAARPALQPDSDWCLRFHAMRRVCRRRWRTRRPLSETAAYVCRGMTCSEPVKSLASLIALTRR